MKLGRVWDYIMRRKVWFVPLLVVFILSGVLGARHLARSLSKRSSLATYADEQTTPNDVPVYNNSLILKIANASAGEPSYQLTFSNNFTRATVKITNSPLTSEAYVRVFDANGQLVRGDYTEIREQKVNPSIQPQEVDIIGESSETEPDRNEQEPQVPDVTAVEYIFTSAPTSYTLELALGSIIEVHSAEARFYSTIDGREAEAFRPATTQRYIVTKNGLQKEGWSETETATQLYNLVRREIVREIETYMSQISDEVLNNRHLDLANKTRIAASYRQLAASDQATYAEFIAHLARGGVPVITYTGETEFARGSEAPNWLDFVEARDGEDGEIAKNLISVNSNVDFSKAGNYEVAFRANDSDNNMSELVVPITITKPYEPVNPEPLPPVNSELSADQGLDSPVNDPIFSVNSQAASSVGGGRNVEDARLVAAATDGNDDNTTVEENQEPTTPTQNSTPVVTTTRNEPTKSEPDTAKETGWKWQNLIWLGLGVIIFIALVRFIFDHYVR